MTEKEKEPKTKKRGFWSKYFGWLIRDNPSAPNVKPMTVDQFPKFKE